MGVSFPSFHISFSVPSSAGCVSLDVRLGFGFQFVVIGTEICSCSSSAADLFMKSGICCFDTEP